MIRFQPWLPSADPQFQGVRLLLLGESHYEEPDEGLTDSSGEHTELTREIVQKQGLHPSRRQVFFANLFSILTGEPWTITSDFTRIWEHVFFYNYVQQLVVGGARHRPTREMFDASSPAFREVLEKLRPQAVLVLGEQLWQAMEPEDGLATPEPTALGKVCLYRLTDGTEVRAARTRHPSSPGFSPLDWAPRVKLFLENTSAQKGRRR